MKIGITREKFSGECRVAATPETARRLIEKLEFDVLIESGAGTAASFRDEDYENAGCTIATNANDVWQSADVVLKVRSPDDSEIKQLREGQTLVCLLYTSDAADE